MRFFAFLCVFLHHTLSQPSSSRLPIQVAQQLSQRATFADGAKFAVSLFFLLSGYLITTLLTIEREQTGTIHLPQFYKRRIARIWPVYYAFMLLVGGIGVAVPRLLPSAGAVLANLSFSGNWFLILGGANEVGALGILWSVNIEEQFYLVWPLALRWNSQNPTRIAAGVVLAAYGLLIVFGTQGVTSDLALRFNPFVEMQFFAAGALLAAWLPRDGLKIPAGLRVLLGCTGLSLWMIGAHLFGAADPRPQTEWWMPAALYGCVLVGCTAIFLSFFGVAARSIPSWLRWLGKISYGLYVYHELVLTLTPRLPPSFERRAIFAGARIGFELAIVIVMAGLSYRWLETPFLRWKARQTFVPNRSL